MSYISEIPESWEFPPEGSALKSESVSFLEFLIDNVFDDYEPSQFHPFRERLISWLNNLDDELEQQALLAILLKCFFVGRRDFEALYRTTFHNVFFRWLVDIHELDVFSADVVTEFRLLVNRAWICPISDSMRINSFLKVNGLKSLDKRPDWRSLKELGHEEKIRSYVEDKGITELILLEDFVGSGTQAAGAIVFAAKLLHETNILFCPLVVCPTGHNKLTELASKHPNIYYEPVIVLPKGEMQDYKEFKAGRGSKEDDFLIKLNSKLDLTKQKDAFGFKATGARVIMYSNCPNNTLPIFHAETSNWKPLFPRVDRQ